MKKILSFILVLLMLTTTLIGVIPSLEVNAAGNKAVRYTVLILDVMSEYSINTNDYETVYVGSSFDNVKNASEKFLEKITQANGENYVAVVECSSNSNISCDFSNDALELKNSVNSIQESTAGFSDVNRAFELAGILLENAPSEADHNIVYFSGCTPAAGKYSYTGVYSEADCSYYVAETEILLYAYANVVYETAKSLFDKGYTIYTLGCVTNLFEQPENYNFFIKVMEDIANAGYYDAANPEDLVFVFEEIASDIINPLFITLSSNKISDIVPVKKDSSTEYYGRYVYEISATIENRDALPARNVECTFIPANEAVPLSEMIYAVQDATKKVGDIPGGSSVTVNFFMEIEHPEEAFNTTYEVSAKADNTLSTKSIGSIFVEEFASEDVNAMEIGIDTWNFPNSHSAFNPQKNETYYLTDKDLTALSNLNSETRKFFKELANRQWEGSCYGMATTAILVKMGVIDVSHIQATATNLHSVNKVNDDNVESFINFYQLQQHLAAHQDKRVEYQQMDSTSRLSTLAKLVAQTGDAPVLLEFYFYSLGKDGSRLRDNNGNLKISGHAVVAYDLLEGSWTWNNTTYNRKIAIYDPNFPNGSKNNEEHLYYNEGTDQWTIPAYCESNNALIGYATNSVSDIDLINHYTANKNADFYLTVLDDTQMMIDDGNTVVHIDGNISDSENVFPLVNVGTIADGNDNSSITYVFQKNNSKSYTVKPTNASSSQEYIMNTPNGTIITKASNVQSITYNSDGGINLSGNDITYNISVIFDESYDSPWTSLKIEGANANTLELSYLDRGILLSGDNLLNVTVTTENDNKKSTTIASTLTPSMYLALNAPNSVYVYIDEDGDGIFERPINDSMSYKIVFDANGGTPEHTIIYTNHEGMLTEIPTVEREGYYFIGWFTGNDYSTEVNIQTVFKSDSTVYAKWINLNGNPDENSYNKPEPGNPGVSKKDSDTLTAITGFISSVASKIGISTSQLIIFACEYLVALIVLVTVIIVIVKRKKRR